jgi:hypothetical protein
MATGIQLEGSDGPLAQGTDNELFVTQYHARNYQLAAGGRVVHAQTAVTGVAPGTAVGTTAAFALANPRGSGKNLVVMRTRMIYLSGTLGTGVVSYVAHKDPAQAAISGTAITGVCGKIDGAGAVGAAYTTATVPTGGTPFRAFATLAPILATSVVFPSVLEDIVDGEIIITAGCAISLQATAAAGTSPLVIYSMTWEEVNA